MPTPPSGPDSSDLSSQIASILLAAGGLVTVAALGGATGITKAQVSEALLELQRSLTGGIRLQFNDREAQLVTAPENVEVVHRFLGTTKPASLSRSALETLTVIAYRQPVTRAEIEATRGANSDRAVQTLLVRELIEERGARMALGRPMQYGTTFGFLEYFGLRTLDELPVLDEDKHVPVRRLGLRAENDQSAGE